MRTVLLLSCGLVFLAVAASATTYVVPTQVPLIGAAMNVASYGDTVLVEPGIYYEYGIDMNSGVVLTSRYGDPGDVVIDAEGYLYHIYAPTLAAGSVIRGITFYRGYMGSSAGSLYFDGGSPTVTNCRFVGCNVGDGGTIYCRSSCDLTLDQCHFYNSNNLVVTGDTSTLRVEGNSTAAITDCTFSDSSSPTAGAAIQLRSFSQATLLNCTIVHNSSGIAGDSFCNFGSVNNTIISGSWAGAAVSCLNNSAASLHCCDVFGNAGGDWTGCIADQADIDGNFSADPAFTGGDYYWELYDLSPGSPCSAAASPCGALIGAHDVRYDGAPVIATITDVPDDQGSVVRIGFHRSLYDDATETDNPVTSYGVWRRVDDPRVSKALDTAQDVDPVRRLSLPGLPLVSWQGRVFLAADKTDSAGIFPPGDWEVLHSVPAIQQDVYTTIAATLGDSTAEDTPFTTYCISSHTTTPSFWFASVPDSGYSVDNLPPALPSDFIYGPGSLLSWQASTEPDFHHYSVFGSDTSVLDGSETLIGYTLSTTHDVSGQDFGFYLLTATDQAGNQSQAAVVSGASAVPGIPGRSVVLYGCKPNPFNPRTRIAFELPSPARVTVRIHDVSGRIVRTLLDGNNVAGGRHEIVWAGVDDSGRALGAGVYICRLDAGRESRTTSMVLLK